MYCSKCGKQIADTAIFCPGCGNPTENYQKDSKAVPQMEAGFMYCKKCGNKIAESAVICPHCGVSVQQQSPAPAQPNVIINNNNVGMGYDYIGVKRKSKVTTLLLAIFLGGLGIHRFYVGKIGTGLLWMCTVGFFGIGWLVDIITIVCGSFRDKYGFPLKE